MKRMEDWVQIVGIEDMTGGAPRVHTIDVWFSERRRTWVVERLDADGHQIGLAHLCDSEIETESCLQDWLRAHAETHLVTPRQTTAGERRFFLHAPRRAA